MILHIGKHDYSEVWDGVYYKALSDYPNVHAKEMRDILDFLVYEKKHHRRVEIQADNPAVLTYVLQEIQHPEKYAHTTPPPIVQECTACPTRHGCMTDLICHTTPLENAVSIFRCGSLLSAVLARDLPGEVLMREPRNAAKDPADFFSYVMFTWGNCQAGDRLVMERSLGRSPTEEEMGAGFTPGIRFYFLYDVLNRHPHAEHDGFLPVKIRDSVCLQDYVFAIILPEMYRSCLENEIPPALVERSHWLSSDALDVWEWSEKAYEYVHALRFTAGSGIL